MTIRKAIQHEETEIHVTRIRDLDFPLSSPGLFASSPIADHQVSDFELPDDVATVQTPLPASLPGPEYHRFVTVQGPALPNDDPNLIYDDWNGPMGDYLPSTEDNGVAPYPSSQLSLDEGNNSPTLDDLPLNALDSDPLAGPETPERDEWAPDDGVQLSDVEDWQPWASKEEALLDMMNAFPRACFSEAELEATRWFAQKCGVDHLPTVRQVKGHRDQVLQTSGMNPTLVEGKLGNMFSIAEFGRIVADEIANPLVRPHLHFFAEDVGEQGRRDYYVEEPALANIDDLGTYAAVMPFRWFMRGKKLWAQVHRLRKHPSDDSLVVDVRLGKHEELPLSAFFASFEELKADHRYYGLPDPTNVAGIAHSGEWSTEELKVEEFTVKLPNPLRITAQGRRIHSLPVWYYCDDTSGNLLYNIHFLATSNISSPLEMFDEFVKMLREAQQEGIAAYDCELDEEVLLIPWIFAMTSDNPMQSEFASHIGLTGKKFCRVCHVSGGDAKNRSGEQGERDRVSDFLKIGDPRSKADTRMALEEQLQEILKAAPSNTATLATNSGVKDKYFQYFAEQLSEYCASLKNQPIGKPRIPRNVIIEKLKRCETHSPRRFLTQACLWVVYFDPNCDTPVEILHVVLLGFVKYFWRDAVSRQNAAGKELLKLHISSFDTLGLDSPRARGHTLLAPAVLQGMIPDNHYEAWLALCRLAPIIFQPTINNLPVYLENLAAAIDDFLAATALWTTQWFNKPKFHVLLHLVDHVRRYGPPILYATKGFESYNFIIRLRSIHSSHHAPSVDIATVFSHLHAIRHLVSGGYIVESQRKDGSLSIKQAGKGIQGLVRDKVFLELMGMSSLFDPPAFGKYHLVPRQTGPGLDWASTSCGAICEPPQLLMKSSVLRQCDSVTLKNEPQVGRVGEILVDARTSRVLSLLIKQYTIGATVLPYRFPSVTASQPEVVVQTLEDCLAMVNMIHNCAAQNCRPSRTKQLAQERHTTTKLEDEIQHASGPGDLLLNLAQLRSAVHLQLFQPSNRYPGLSKDKLIHKAVEIRQALDLSNGTSSDATGPTKTSSRKCTLSQKAPGPPKRLHQGLSALSAPTPARDNDPSTSRSHIPHLHPHTALPSRIAPSGSPGLSNHLQFSLPRPLSPYLHTFNHHDNFPTVSSSPHTAPHPHPLAMPYYQGNGPPPVQQARMMSHPYSLIMPYYHNHLPPPSQHQVWTETHQGNFGGRDELDLEGMMEGWYPPGGTSDKRGWNE
ncbi:hypothetical protein JAAARDRAFT_209796 [Jaapia argillacea MUCL 33604]|uniref:Uncharacterized protein n=1 Tax=Jaapia argillacea MUCL 33604 TaxID=933084 RepID=A0A067PG36_9AGAM|nr:hypothetical protein JAAARDRAFT_209796 [Jaapia argillacea MUCL 33604]